MVRLWDLQGNSIGEPYEGPKESYEGFVGAIDSVSFSPDGQIIIAASYEFLDVRVWPIGGWLSYTCNRLKGYLLLVGQVESLVYEARKTCEKYAW